jgi:hypothetical protein
MQQVANNRTTFKDELAEALEGFVEAVSSLIEAEHWVQSTATNSLSRARWLRLQALDGAALQAWIGAEVERANQSIMAACELGGCLLPEDQPEAVRNAIGLAERVADSLLAVGSRGDLRRLTPTLLDALEGLYGALEPLEAALAPSPCWSKDELIAATAGPGSPATSDNTLVRVLRRAGLRGTRGVKGRRFGPTEVRRLIEAAPEAVPNEAQRCIRAWTDLLDRTGCRLRSSPTSSPS